MYYYRNGKLCYDFGKLCETWSSKEGSVKVKDMTTVHILNCMKKVREDNDWYIYFLKELNNRVGIKIVNL